MRGLACGLCLLVLLPAGGCSGSRERKVTGTVTWEGKPVAEGTINLIPTDPNLPAASGKIVNGVYEVLALPGPMKVEIFATREVGEYLPQMGMAAREMYIPEEYNAESTLTLEVAASGENTFPFELPLKKK